MLSRLVRDIFRPARHDVGAGAKKFALCAHNGPKLAFDGALGKYFRGNAAGAAVLVEFFADQQSWDTAGRVCCAEVLLDGPAYWHP